MPATLPSLEKILNSNKRLRNESRSYSVLKLCVKIVNVFDKLQTRQCLEKSVLEDHTLMRRKNSKEFSDNYQTTKGSC